MSDELRRLVPDAIKFFEIEEVRKASNDFLANLDPERFAVVEMAMKKVTEKSREIGAPFLYGLLFGEDLFIIIADPKGKTCCISEALFDRIAEAAGIDLEDA
jgi:hypothetical protein